MNQSAPPDAGLARRRPFLRVAAGKPAAFVMLSTGALLLAASFLDRPALRASPSLAFDSDKDGLKDIQEEILQTLPDNADSDGDGFSDLEEIARGSDPLLDLVVPAASELGVGMAARSVDGVVTIVSSIYSSSGSFQNVRFQLGFVLHGQPVVIPTQNYLRVSNWRILAASGGGILLALETPFSSQLVANMGSLSLFAAAGERDSPYFDVAAGMTLVDFSGVTMSVGPVPEGLGDGLIYDPISPDEDIPTSFTGGQVCWQTTNPVGSNGASSVHEVESASCESTDSHCSAGDCSAGVGTTVEVVDPGVLIGG
jgi:hypothetical protein